MLVRAFFTTPLFYLTVILDIDHDPRKIARDARKDRIAKNEKKHSQNVARASGPNTNPRDARKTDIEKTLAATRISTASMGKFDKRLDGEKKLRGVKRKACRFPSSLRNVC
jgi:regulator of ribosome biosynthesis